MLRYSLADREANSNSIWWNRQHSKIPFNVDSETGDIIGEADLLSETYRFNVSVTDGKYIAVVPVVIDVRICHNSSYNNLTNAIIRIPVLSTVGVRCSSGWLFLLAFKYVILPRCISQFHNVIQMETRQNASSDSMKAWRSNIWIAETMKPDLGYLNWPSCTGSFRKHTNSQPYWWDILQQAC